MLARYAGTKAEAFLEKRKAAEPELPGGGDLPPNIENGVAQVVLCGFGTVAAGKPSAGALFFQAQAVVKLPREVGGIPVAGRRTRIMKTVASAAQFQKGEYDEKAMAWVQDQLKMLAKSPSGGTLDPAMFTLKRLESTAALIQKAKPHTLFRTWKGSRSDVRLVDGKWWLCNLNDDGTVKATVSGKGPYASKEAAQKANQFAGKEPMVNHTWGGSVAWVEPSANGQAAAHVEDETPQIPVETDVAAPTAPFDEFEGQEETGEEAEAGEDYSASDDLDAMVAAAVDNRTARARLTELAVAAGIEQDAIAVADGWQEVADMLVAAQAGGEEAEEEEAAEWAPEVGEVYGYKPLVVGKDGKKVRGKKQVDCTVMSVDADKQTVQIKSNVDKKTLYKGVKWADLTHLDE